MADRESSSIKKEKDERKEPIKKKVKTEKIVDYNSSDEDGKDTKANFMDINIANDYYCSLCQSQMNSQLTWDTHLGGKRHVKKAQAAIFATQRRMMPSSDGYQQFRSATGSGLIAAQDTNESAQIQPTLDEIRDQVLVGLDFIKEIWSKDEHAEPMYFCSLCDANCQRITIINHAIGYKHRLQYLKLKKKDAYEWFANSSEKKSFLSDKLAEEALIMEKNYGRGFVKVAVESDDFNVRDMDIDEDAESLNDGDIYKKEKDGLKSQKKKPPEVLSEELQVKGMSASTIQKHFEALSDAERLKVIKSLKVLPHVSLTDKKKELEIINDLNDGYIDCLLNSSPCINDWMDSSYGGDFEWAAQITDKMFDQLSFK